MKAMTRKILIFLAINAVIATLAAMAPLSLINGEGYIRVEEVYEYIESAAPGTELNVILGDSRSDCCVAAKDIGFINLSYQGASPVEGYDVLKRLLERGIRIDKLILSYGPFHIFTQDAFHAQTRYFGLTDSRYTDSILQLAAELDDQEYLDYQWQALEVLDREVPWLPDRLKFRVVNVMTIDRTIKAAWSQSLRRLTNPEQQDALRAEIGRKFYESTAPDRINYGAESPEHEKPDAASPVNEIYLSKLVELAKQHEIAVKFLIMPVNRDVSQPPETYYDRYLTILEEAGLKGCYGPIYRWPNELFADTHHLNVSGAHKFQSVLRKQLDYCR
jgi:hypothetical protein